MKTIKYDEPYTEVTADTHIAETVAVQSPSNIIKTNLMLALDGIVISLLVVAAIYIDIMMHGRSLSERSITEISQQLLLAITAFSFFKYSVKAEVFNRATFLAGSFFLVLLIRELDHWFDFIHHGSWVYPALAATFAGLFVFFKEKATSNTQFIALMNHKYMPFLISGVIMLLVFSRLAGIGEFWKAVMGDNYLREVKNIVEEGSELLSYYVITYASIKITKESK